MSEQQAIDGWYIVEIFGHQRFAGYCTIVPVGSEAFVRIDVPELAERTRVTKRGGYVTENGVDSSTYAPAGSTVKESATQPYSKLFGPKAVYSMTPCTQEACLKAVEELQPRALMLVSLPSEKAIAAGTPGDVPPETGFDCCDGNVADGHAPDCPE